MFLPVFHLSVVALNSFTLWYDQKYVDLPFPNEEIKQIPLKARPIFLTVWCLVLQTIYFAISFLNDIGGSNATIIRKPPLLRKIKDIIFSIAFPLAIYVFLAFWSLYIIHKDLIFPDGVEKQFPVWLNHVMHTLIVPFICLELLITRRNYPSRKFGVLTVIYFMISYVVLLLVTYIKYGIWAYPFLKFFNWPMRAAFVSLSTVVGIGIYIIGEKLNNAVSPSSKVYINGVNGKKH